MKENFIKNYDKLLEFVESKQNENDVQKVSIYMMTTNINYIELKKKLIKSTILIITN